MAGYCSQALRTPSLPTPTDMTGTLIPVTMEQDSVLHVVFLFTYLIYDYSFCPLPFLLKHFFWPFTLHIVSTSNSKS